MLNVEENPNLSYNKDERTVSPAAGNSAGWPDPIPVGCDQYRSETNLCHRGVAEIKAGGMPVTPLALYGLPTAPEEFPEPLRRRIEAKAAELGCTFGFAFAAVVKMDDPMMMFRVGVELIAQRGGTIHPDLHYTNRDDHPDNPDLVTNIHLRRKGIEAIDDRMEDTFDAKNDIDYPRPWQGTSLPDDIAEVLLTLFADPIVEAGAGHSEVPPGHAANAAEAFCVLVKWCIMDDETRRLLEIMLRLCAQGRSAGGLHLWFHVQQTFDHVLQLHGVHSSLHP